MENESSGWTSIEQSKKLLYDYKLNPETADLYYNTNFLLGARCLKTEQDMLIPSWSMGKLIELMPHEICVINNPGLTYYLRMGKAEDEFWISYESSIADLSGSWIGFNTKIDKCTMLDCIVNMIGWLLELGYIKKEN